MSLLEKSTYERTGGAVRSITYHRTPYNGHLWSLMRRFAAVAPLQPGTSYFRLSQDPKHLGSRFLLACLRRMLHATAPTAPAFDAHCLRHTFASMLDSIHVRHTTICHVGGWRPGRQSAVFRYIDPTYPQHPISYILFNGLLPPSLQDASANPSVLLGQL